MKSQELLSTIVQIAEDGHQLGNNHKFVNGSTPFLETDNLDTFSIM